MTSPAGADTLASDRLAALLGADTRAALRKLSMRPGAAETATVQAAIWAALADAGALRATGVRDTLPLAELMGDALYRGPYLDALAAMDVMAALGEQPRWQPIRAAASDGEIAIAVTRPGTRLVRCADMADMLLDFHGPVVTVTDLHQPGVDIRPCADLARGGLFEVSVAEPARPVLSAAWPGGSMPDAVLDAARTRHAGYLTGLCRGAHRLAVGHARNRKVFGRPVGGHQAPAFRLAALAARIEAVCSLTYEGDQPRHALRLARALALDTTAETLQLHGAAGLLDTSDAQLFYRCALTEAALAH